MNPLRHWRKAKEHPRDTKLTFEDFMKIKAAAASPPDAVAHKKPEPQRAPVSLTKSNHTVFNTPWCDGFYPIQSPSTLTCKPFEV